MKQIIILAFVFFCSLNIIAQTNVKTSDQVNKEVEILKKADLNLTDIQISRITQVLIGQEQILNRNKQVLEGNKSLLDQRLKELKVNKMNNLRGVLNEQQVQKFDALDLSSKF